MKVGEAFVGVATLAAGGTFIATAGIDWGRNSPIGVDRHRPAVTAGTDTGTAPEGSETTTEGQAPLTTLPITDLVGIKAEMERLSQADPWCTTLQVLSVKPEYVLPEGGQVPFYGVSNGGSGSAIETPTGTVPVEQDGYVDVVPCIDAKSLRINPFKTDESIPDHIIGFWTTSPEITQNVQGAPSLFLHYADTDPVKDRLAKCISARDEMAEMIMRHLVMVVGPEQAAEFTIELHISPENGRHPCDNSFVVPLMNQGLIQVPLSESTAPTSTSPTTPPITTPPTTVAAG